MKRTALFLLVALALSPAFAAPKALKFGRFGDVLIFRSTTTVKDSVILMSGDDGWTTTDTKIAQKISALNAIVIGVDMGRYRTAARSRKEKCAYPAADLEELSQYVQRELKLPAYIPPILMGRGTGATLAYAALAQAPTNTFPGAISLGFCPLWPEPHPFCRGQGLESDAPSDIGVMLHPVRTLEVPWVVIEGSHDNVCDAQSVESFVKQVFHGDIVLVPNLDHDFTNPDGWFPKMKDDYERIADGDDVTPPSVDASTKGLPIVEVRGQGPSKNLLAVIISGDGGWAGIDRELSKRLSAEGVDVVGLNSLKYFWKRRTPDDAGKDLERLIRHYMTGWNRQTVILIGYSRGADVMPFMANRLPADILAKVPLIALLGLEKSVDFEIHPSDLFDMKHKNELPVRPEIDKLKIAAAGGPTRIACFTGADETDSLCHELPTDTSELVIMKGGHHFGGAYKELAQDILTRAHRQ